MEPAPAGRRARSEITLTIEVIHDGDPDVLAEHLAVDVRAMLVRIDPVVQVDVEARTLIPGDELSAQLPAWF